VWDVMPDSLVTSYAEMNATDCSETLVFIYHTFKYRPQDNSVYNWGCQLGGVREVLYGGNLTKVNRTVATLTTA
jgi:hypothetical protein